MANKISSRQVLRAIGERRSESSPALAAPVNRVLLTRLGSVFVCLWTDFDLTKYQQSLLEKSEQVARGQG